MKLQRAENQRLFDQVLRRFVARIEGIR